MQIAERLPSMTDKEIANLAANAQRLSGEGNPSQREAAEAILPAIKAEQDARIAAKPAPAKRKAPVKKVAATAAA